MLAENLPKRIFIIGISGVTCGGKTTVANKLKQVFLKSKIFSQDDYYRDVNDPKHVWIPKLNHINFDIVSSVDMEKMYSDVLKFMEDNNFVHIDNDEPATKNYIQQDSDILDRINKSDIHILIIEGFSIFSFKTWLYLFNLKYFLTLDKEECYKRRIQRVYEPPDCPGFFDICVWPEYLKQKDEIKKSVTNLKFVDHIDSDFWKTILEDVFECIHDKM